MYLYVIHSKNNKIEFFTNSILSFKRKYRLMGSSMSYHLTPVTQIELHFKEYKRVTISI